MKNFIIALEVSDVRSKAKVHADFDSIEHAEDYMLGIGGDVLLHETKDIIVLKRQDHNQWWRWDRNEPTIGWVAFEIPEVVAARQQMSKQLTQAQNLIDAAYHKGQVDPEEPTACVEAHLTVAYVAELRAKAAMTIAEANRVFLEAILEAHGNIDWPN
jgi:hypothetical protein